MTSRSWRACSAKRAQVARMARQRSTIDIVPARHTPLKLRREPEEYWTEPRKVHKKVTLPKLKCLEDRDEP